LDTTDNFLDALDFTALQSTVTDANFPWFYQNSVAWKSMEDGFEDDPYNFQFVHSFYERHAPNSGFIKLIEPILDKLNPTAIIRIKANLITRAPTIEEHIMHVDVPDVSCKTSIFYINTNDGYTKFEDGTVVNSIENRLVTFDSTMKHCGTTCTDSKYRIAINFNYF
jgi:hypothetical protein